MNGSDEKIPRTSIVGRRKDPSVDQPHLFEDPFGSAHQVTSVERTVIQHPSAAALEERIRAGRQRRATKKRLHGSTLKKKHLGVKF